MTLEKAKNVLQAVVIVNAVGAMAIIVYAIMQWTDYTELSGDYLFSSRNPELLTAMGWNVVIWIVAALVAALMAFGWAAVGSIADHLIAKEKQAD